MINQKEAQKFTTQTRCYTTSGFFNEPFTQAIFISQVDGLSGNNIIDASGQIPMYDKDTFNIRMNKDEYNVTQIEIIIPDTSANTVVVIFTKYDGFTDQYQPLTDFE